MAGVDDQDLSKVIIKKEVEDTVESPDNTEVQDSSQSTPDANGSSKNTKALWGEDETRSMIELHKNYLQRFKEGNYSKKQLLEDVTQELNLIGYDITAEKVRNKMKYLRARYKGVMNYNARHVAKKIMPFEEELTELYNMEYFDDQESLLPNEVNGNGDVSFESNTTSTPVKTNKRAKLTPAPHVDLKTVVTKKKRVVSRTTKIIKKKRGMKRSGAPLFQCGLCMEKFRTSSDMHDHRCNTPAKPNNLVKKRSPVNPASHLFHWNSLITMQFLDLLKEYQDSHKNSNFRKGNIWENMSSLMKRMGHKIHPKELSRKWNALTTSFKRTVTYNNSHEDKKKCAFFKRLMDLHNHPASFNCFKERNVPAKRTVEVSPFSFSQGPSVISSKQPPPTTSNQKVIKDEKMKQGGSSSELITWLNNTWTEYKEMERKRLELQSQRHNEIMEMLSYLIDSKDKHH